MLKKSISYWSFPGGGRQYRRLRFASSPKRKDGFEAVEICVARKGVLTPKTGEKKVKAIAAQARDAGVEIAGVATGMYWARSMSDPSKRVRDFIIEDTKRCLRIARWAGTDALLTIPASVDAFFIPGFKVVPYDLAYARAKDAIRRLLPTAEKCSVALAVENVWNQLFMSPLELRDFIDAFKSPYVAAYFDVGNIVAFGHPEHWINILAHRIKRVHFKDYNRARPGIKGFCDLGKGSVNWPAVTAALRKHYSYQYCTAEMPPSKSILPRTSKAMDKILGRK